jgi:ABC-2 type transport system ATP-binding protein
MIEIRSLCKYYQDFLAVDHLDLVIEKGHFFGLLGPNGAGKTTTLKMLSMLLNPSEGEILIDGRIISRKDRLIKQNIGVVTQHLSLQRELTVKETLTHHGYLQKMSRQDIKRRIQTLTEFAKLEDQLNKPVEKLSGGNKRKLMIIRSMMHEPKVIFLDEPTVGLDPGIRRDIWDLLKKLKSRGLTIIMTTHYIEEANHLCDEIGMMRRGKLIKVASPMAYLSEIKPYVVEVFNGEATKYLACDTKEEAAEHAKSAKGDVLIRKSNLEDVYISYTNEKVG